MRFWRIRESLEHVSDYKHSYVNGSLEHPYGLPGVNCDVCGDTWGGSRILPFECPESFRRHKNITERWPISRAEHETLQKNLMDPYPYKVIHLSAFVRVTISSRVFLMFLLVLVQIFSGRHLVVLSSLSGSRTYLLSLAQTTLPSVR